MERSVRCERAAKRVQRGRSRGVGGGGGRELDAEWRGRGRGSSHREADENVVGSYQHNVDTSFLLLPRVSRFRKAAGSGIRFGEMWEGGQNGSGREG